MANLFASGLVAGATGGTTGVYGSFQDSNFRSDYAPRQQGVFAENPLATPKYALNNKVGGRDAEFRDTLARMYISLADASEPVKTAYLKSLPNDDRVKALAQVLIGPNNNKGTSKGFIDFFLQQANEGFQEKLQIDEVLGDNYVAWYFGQSPPVFQYSGMLMNSMQDDQVTGFALAYQHLLRGTQLARKGTLLRLRYDNVIVEGTINTMSRALNADSEMACPFSFSLLVKGYIFLVQLPFTKMRQEDYVQLQTAFAPDAVLDKIGRIVDRRVRTTTLLPQQPHAESSVGSEEPQDPVNYLLEAPGQMADQIRAFNQIPITNGLESPYQTLVPEAQLTPYAASLPGG